MRAPFLDSRLTRLVRDNRYQGLRLMLLFGSRARSDAREGADWDIAYLGGPGFDPDQLLADLVGALGSDRIDLVDLARASGQLRYRAARDGRVLFQATGDDFPRFWIEAVSFWCDVAPIVASGYDAVLSRLER